MLSPAKKTNILIIDDNAKNIQLAANVLKTTDLFNIFFAITAEAGIAQLSTKEYALILLDINMPGMDGYEAATIIKQDPKTAHIPIIFLSANADQDSINKGFEHGGQDYITKPFQQLELIHRVKTHVELFLAKKELQKEVDESQVILKQYKDAIDITSLVSKTDINGIITYVNEPFCTVSQYSKEELIGKTHRKIKHENTPAWVFEEMWRTITNKKVWKGTIENKKKDGSSYFVDASIIPILNHENEIIEYISVRTDITKQILAKDQIISSQKEILYTLGEMGEIRSRETGDHVNRVALYSSILATKYGLSAHEVEMFQMASPMHDIGKIAIADSILLKPSQLTAEEFEEMKKHTSIGYDIFKKSSHKMLQLAATIASEHHEKWDGTGYPKGLKGEEISIYGRITAIADVFDALCHERVYKKAWLLEDAIEYIQQQSERAFDPKLVDIFIENIDTFVAIKKKYSK